MRIHIGMVTVTVVVTVSDGSPATVTIDTIITSYV